MSDKEKVIYCAGILEGEGSFIKKSKNSMYIQCQMTDKDIVERLQKFLGGSMRQNKDRNPRWKTVWCWNAYGDRAEKIARDILPYMGERRSAKITELLEARNIKKVFNHTVDMIAKEYLSSDKSLRQLENETGFSRQTILRHSKKLEM